MKKFNIHYVPSKELGNFYGMNLPASHELHYKHPLLRTNKDILIDKRLGKRMRAKTILHEEIECLAMSPKMHYKKADSYALAEEHFVK